MSTSNPIALVDISEEAQCGRLSYRCLHVSIPRITYRQSSHHTVSPLISFTCRLTSLKGAPLSLHQVEVLHKNNDHQSDQSPSPMQDNLLNSPLHTPRYGIWTLRCIRWQACLHRGVFCGVYRCFFRGRWDLKSRPPNGRHGAEEKERSGNQPDSHGLILAI